MLIDSHTHLFPTGLDKVGTAEMLVSQMNRSGVDKAVILGIYPRVTNEFIAEQVKKHPKRFIGFASVDPNEGKDALSLLRQCVETYQVRGLKLHPSMQHFQADDIELLKPLMQYVEILAIPVLMHSWGWFGQNSEADPTRIMKLAREFPDVTFIMAHCGGMRFMDLLPLGRLRKHGELDNLFVDLSVILFDLDESPLWPFLRWTVQTIGFDRVLIGSDFPDYSVEETFSLARSLNFSDEETAKMLGGNARDLFSV